MDNKLNYDDVNHIHIIMEILEFIYSKHIGEPISEYAILHYNIYYKFFLYDKKFKNKYFNLLFAKNIFKNAKINIQPILLSFLIENKMFKQVCIWNNSIGKVNNAYNKLLIYYLNKVKS